jgi:rubrerythrin
MDDKRLIQRLRILAKFDVDATGAYQAAIERVTDQAIKDKLNAFRLDHARHVQDYNEHLTRLGGEPVQMEPDVAGVVLRGITALTSTIGTRAALLAMFGNEELSIGTYEVMLRMPWPTEIGALIARNREDERRHLAWMKQAVKAPRRVARLEAEQPT